MSDTGAGPPPTPEQARALERARALQPAAGEWRRAARTGAGVALGLGLTGVQALMRPDDVAPGRGRCGYQLAFGGLTTLSGLLTNPAGTVPDAAGNDIDPRRARRIELATAIGVGAVSAAFFHPRFSANWWGDRLLGRFGVTHTRTAGALIAVSVSAGLVVFGDRIGQAADLRLAALDAAAEEVEGSEQGSRAGDIVQHAGEEPGPE